jgi:hypothetical protein
VISRFNIGQRQLARLQVIDMHRRFVRTFRKLAEEYDLSWSNRKHRDTLTSFIARDYLIDFLMSVIFKLKAKKSPFELLHFSLKKKIINSALLRWETFYYNDLYLHGTLLVKFWKASFASLSSIITPQVSSCVGPSSFIISSIQNIQKQIEHLYFCVHNQYKNIFLTKKQNNCRNLVFTDNKRQNKFIKFSNTNCSIKSNNSIMSLGNVYVFNIAAPVQDICQILIQKGFWHSTKHRAICRRSFLFLNDWIIITEYAKVMYTLLYTYRFVVNFNTIKGIVLKLRQGCIFTLCRKHHKSKNWIHLMYGDNICYRDQITKKVVAQLPSFQFIREVGKKCFKINISESSYVLNYNFF